MKGTPVRASVVGASKKEKDLDYLRPLTSAPRHKREAVFDIESKTAGSEFKAGFERAFLVGFYDGEDHGELPPGSPNGARVVGYKAFRNYPSRKKDHAKLKPTERAIANGGCIDRFCRYILGGKGDWKQTARIDLCKRYARLYSHNGGAFDMSFVLAWLELPEQQKEFQWEAVLIQSRLLSLSVWREKSTEGGEKKRTHRTKYEWEFVDSLFLLPMTLAKVGESFSGGDVEAQKATSFDMDTHEDDPEWEVYNKLDCRTLYRGIDKLGTLVEGIGGSLSITAASTAMKLFRRKFLVEPIPRARHFPECGGVWKVKDKKTGKRVEKKRPHRCGSDACLHRWILDGYCGGRTEVIHTAYTRAFRAWDINSSYPCSMLSEMPAGLALSYKNETVEHYLRQRDGRRRVAVGFVEAEVFIPPMEPGMVPPLPLKCIDGKLRFPTGHLYGVWTDDELQLLEDSTVNGKILKIHRSVWFEKRPVFQDYVSALYAFRQDAKAHPNDMMKQALSAMAKILINALYGKTAERKDKERLIHIRGGIDPIPGDPLCEHDSGRPFFAEDELKASLWVVNESRDKEHIVPQLAAYVTSLSRIKLWKAMRDAWIMGGMVLYVDSDSIRVSAPVGLTGKRRDAWYVEFERVIGVDSSELGKWSREKDEDGNLDFNGTHHRPKLYALWSTKTDKLVTIKAKGIPKRERTEENFGKLLRGEAIHYKRRMMPRTILKGHHPAPLDVKTHKAVTSEFDKREVYDDGSTSPIHYEKRTAAERKKKCPHGRRAVA